MAVRSLCSCVAAGARPLGRFNLVTVVAIQSFWVLPDGEAVSQGGTARRPIYDRGQYGEARNDIKSGFLRRGAGLPGSKGRAAISRSKPAFASAPKKPPVSGRPPLIFDLYY